MALWDVGAPMGYSESAHAMPEQALAGTPDFLRYLTSEAKLDRICAEVADRKLELSDLFEQAVKRDVARVGSLDDLPDGEFVKQKFARPPGYCAQTVLHLGRLAVMSLLDYGATCSGMPEEVAIGIISHALKRMDEGAYTQEDDCYPIVKLYKYEVSPVVDGVAAGKPIHIKYALTLRCEFVPV